MLSFSLEGLELQASTSPSQEEKVDSPEKVSEEEKPDVVKMVGEAIEENFVKFDKITKLHCLYDGDEFSEDEDEDVVDEQSPSKAAVSSPSKETETAEGVSNLEVLFSLSESPLSSPGLTHLTSGGLTPLPQVAWEMLEMARIVFIKQAAASQGAAKVEAEYKVLQPFRLSDYSSEIWIYTLQIYPRVYVNMFRLKYRLG